MKLLFDDTKTLEDLENDIWKDDKNYPTGLVERCFKFRKIPVNNLTIEELRTLVSQNIGLYYIIPIAYKKLRENILAEGNFYAGDLLSAVVTTDKKFWESNPLYWKEIVVLINQNADILQKEVSPRSALQKIEDFKFFDF